MLSLRTSCLSSLTTQAVTMREVLLLSATPYKMMTTTGEVDDDHHRDLVDTFAFLVSHDPCAVSQLRMELKDLRRSLLQIGRDHGEAARAARVPTLRLRCAG